MQTSDLAPMNADIGARLIEAAGSESFGEILLAAAYEVGGVEEIFGYSARQSEAPQKLFSHSRISGAEERVARYSSRFFKHDPALLGDIAPVSIGGFCRRIRPHDIAPYDYRHLCFERPHFVEKISFGWRSPDSLLMLSFYRSHVEDEEATWRLARLADVALGAMGRAQPASDIDELVQILEQRLHRKRPELTHRERQVTTRLIVGWTSQRIAQQLGIGIASVITYRRRSLQRCGLTTITDFLPELVH